MQEIRTLNKKHTAEEIREGLEKFYNWTNTVAKMEK